MTGEQKKGVLYLCATPIGNLEDITLRALRVMREADLIAAEDTRHTRKLLSHYDLHTPLTSYHQHNRRKKGDYLLELLSSGKNVALVTDAGLPGISDPGSEMVSMALENGCEVVPVPGPSAAVTALVVSGLPTESFVFLGFLPLNKKARHEKLVEVSSLRMTLVFYEAPHRLKSFLDVLLKVFGNRQAAVARELTKKFEEIIRGDLVGLIKHFEENEPRGEVTLVVSGAQGEQSDQIKEDTWLDLEPAAHVAKLEAEGIGRKEAIRDVARVRGLPRREVYRAVVDNK